MRPVGRIRSFQPVMMRTRPAFSLQTSSSLPVVAILKTKIRKLTERSRGEATLLSLQCLQHLRKKDVRHDRRPGQLGQNRNALLVSPEFL